MNLKRGFQRIAWALVAVAIPVVWFVAYQLSEYVAGYAPRLVGSDATTVRESSKAILVDDVGVFYFPTYLPEADIEVRMRAVYDRAKATHLPEARRRQSIDDFANAIRSKYPEYSDLKNTDLVSRVLAKFPVYRDTVNFREFEVDEVREKRPLWAFGATIAVVAGFAGVLFGSIALVAWIARGFRDTPKPAV